MLRTWWLINRKLFISQACCVNITTKKLKSFLLLRSHCARIIAYNETTFAYWYLARNLIFSLVVKVNSLRLVKSLGAKCAEYAFLTILKVEDVRNIAWIVKRQGIFFLLPTNILPWKVNQKRAISFKTCECSTEKSSPFEFAIQIKRIASVYEESLIFPPKSHFSERWIFSSKKC